MNQSMLTADDFTVFFQELWGKDPFPWQCEFARRVCAGQWPKYVAVPTGSGKTACLDAAVFALAVQASQPVAERTQGRRIFFIVNRRIIVDEAYERAGKLCCKLAQASPDSVIWRVAAALRTLTGNASIRPLTRAQLRGGIYRDRSWAGSLLQPMIICSTVDQAGSRLLFRGYGVSPQARPVHAALVAQDSLLIIDEAHISRPFIQTLDWVERYRAYQPPGCETIRLPFKVIQMTATPPAGVSGAEKLTLTEEDHEHLVLKPRLTGAKLAKLVIEDKAKGKAREAQMAARLVKETKELLSTRTPNSIAVMVNRVATARMIYAELKKEHEDCVRLLIGRLRPMDREDVTKEIQERLKTGAAPREHYAGPDIVVSTQCLEVGADLDFEALVTEAASLDALRQRFGRLNRAGLHAIAHAVIVLPADQNLALEKLDEASPCDPIYGNTIPRTWHWLQGLTQNGIVDFGVNSMTDAVETFRSANSDAFAGMLSPTSDAPVLLPAYLDCWVQTNPSPAADPDVTLFLQGPQRDTAEVQVCWRADLPEENREGNWTDILSLCPPTAVECLPVPLHVFRAWIDSKGRFQDSSSDVGEMPEVPDKKNPEEGRGIPALIWRGPEESISLATGSLIRPGDTIVIRVQSGGWEALGYIPNAPEDPQSKAETKLTYDKVKLVDLAERGAAIAHHRAVLRIHPELWPVPGNGTIAAELVNLSRDEECNWSLSEISDLLGRLLDDENPGWMLDQNQRSAIEHLRKRKSSELSVDLYPDFAGIVIGTRVVMLPKGDGDEALNGSDFDEDALLETRSPQGLCEHTSDVLGLVESSLALLPLSAWREALIAAAAFHDWGKADPRFQALLRSTSPFAAIASGVLLAKSGNITSSAASRRSARNRAGLPIGFRHEMLSVQMVESEVGASLLPTSPVLRALILHLVATHHGYGRPFAPVMDDSTPPDVSLTINDKAVFLTSAERTEHPSHALDSGIAERFWELTRRHGWWGLALLETVLRLADQKASANPQTTSKS